MPDNEATSMDALRRSIDITTRASIGIIAIRCPVTEVFRAVELLYASARDNSSAFRMWSMLTGWSQFDEDIVNDLASVMDGDDDKVFNPIMPHSEDRTTIAYSSAFQKIFEADRELRTYPDDCYYVMADLHHYLTEPQIEAAIRRQAQRAYDSDQRLFVVIPDTVEIPDNISPFLHLIEYEYPRINELLQIVELILDNLEDEHQPDLSDEEKHALCQNALGMTKTSFENAIALSITDWHQDREGNEEEPVSYEHICKWVRNYKTEALRKTEVLELQPELPVDQIGGLQEYKNWMDIRKVTYQPEAIAKGITPSKGVVVVGPPGCGKSLIAKAAGAQLGLPVIRFDIGRVFGAYVGQSEGKMRSVLKMVDAMAPLVLMVDEVDKGFAGMAQGSSDSGTSSRVFGTFLTWMQERDQKNRPVFLVFTANRVQGLPPEILRKGRLDESWAVLAPNKVEREEILRIHAKKRGLTITEEHMPKLVTHSEGLVGAEIESLVEQCLIRAYMNGHEKLMTADFLIERQTLKPIKESAAADFTAIEEWGRTYARLASTEESEKPQIGSPKKAGSTSRRPSIKKRPMLN